jgi:protein PsiE
MVGVFYNDNRIPVTLPIIIAITALTRMIVLQTKGLDAVNIIFEASGILLLAIAAYIMSTKEKRSLTKLKARGQEEK